MNHDVWISSMFLQTNHMDDVAGKFKDHQVWDGPDTQIDPIFWMDHGRNFGHNHPPNKSNILEAEVVFHPSTHGRVNDYRIYPLVMSK